MIFQLLKFCHCRYVPFFIMVSFSLILQSMPKQLISLFCISSSCKQFVFSNSSPIVLLLFSSHSDTLDDLKHSCNEITYSHLNKLIFHENLTINRLRRKKTNEKERIHRKRSHKQFYIKLYNLDYYVYLPDPQTTKRNKAKSQGPTGELSSCDFCKKMFI